MKFGSVCSGIEAASVAWHPLGWKAAWLAEIEPFPSAVLAHHYPDVPNLGDMTKIADRIRSGEIEAPDVFCGGTPCQAFSVAGLRKSLDDARGNLSLTFCEIANEIDSARSVRGEQPTIVFWENVPGVLNTKDNAFGCFLAGLAGEDDPLVAPGGKWTNAGAVLGPKRAVAWRVTDAQYFGVAQRRRRVFVVASARDGFDPTAVLFEFDGLRRDIAPSRESREVAPTIPSRSTAGGGLGTDFDLDGGVIESRGGEKQWPAEISCTLDTTFGTKQGLEDQHVNAGCPMFVPVTTHTLRGEGFDASEDGTGRGTPIVPVAFDTTQVTSKTNRSNPKPGDPCRPLAAGAHAPSVAFAIQAGALRTNPNSGPDGVGVQADHAYTLEARSEVQAVAAVSIQDVRGTDKAQNGRGWNDDGSAYTLDTHATQGVIVGALACNTGPNGHDAGNFACNQAVDAGHVLPVFSPVAYTTKLHNTGSNNAGKIFEERTTCLDANSPPPALLTAMQVRRLTPVECERLQGFPDGYTQIPWRKKPAGDCPDGPRYKALGNSWAVPNVAWIGLRIQAHLDGLL